MTMDESREPPDYDWSLVVPVKRLAIAKSRLNGAAGPHRPALALAFAADTVSAALRTPRVCAVFVVTDDPEADALSRSLGARVVPDRDDAGLNPALRWGAQVAAEAHPGAGVGALSADLPALRSVELSAVLGFAARAALLGRAAVVADAGGRGTTVYLSGPGVPFEPAFGPQSLDAHLRSGALAFDEADVPSVRRDVDTPADLRVALSLGVGRHTSEVMTELTDQQIGR
jgi:2-phospho-L-lactate/phosphoenolpyruvate guanylyltransferase